LLGVISVENNLFHSFKYHRGKKQSIGNEGPRETNEENEDTEVIAEIVTPHRQPAIEACQEICHTVISESGWYTREHQK